MKAIYLDYAAATPVADEVLAAMEPYWQKRFHNSSGLYLAARSNKQALEKARGDIAHWLGARPGEVIFTAGATEANHLAVQGVLRRYPEGEVLVSATEHAAVIRYAGKSAGKLIPVDDTGRINLTALGRLITEKTVIVSVHYANNETGTIQPLKQIAAVVADERRRRRKTGQTLPIYFHTDAVQAAQYLDLHVNRLGVDLMTISAGKIYGPKQVAALYVKSGVDLQPTLSGGGQERGLRSGTENLAGAVGLATALNLVQTARKEEAQRIAALRDKLQASLPRKAIVTGHKKHRLPNFLNFAVSGFDGERLVMELDEAGVQAATGAACSANNDEPSHVLVAMGLKRELIQGSIRFSLGKPTSEQEIEAAANALKQILA